jgi:methyl-accepting chemotaxis protein
MKTNALSKIKLGIGAKVTLALLATGLLTTLATSYIATTRGTEQLREKSYQQLKSVRTTLQGHIQEYLGNARRDLEAMADSLTVRQALPELAGARSTLLADIETAGGNLTAESQTKIKTDLAGYYEKVLATNLQKVRNVEAVPVEGLMPHKPEAQLLQYVYTVLNPSAVGSKSDLTSPADIAGYATSLTGLAQAFAKTDYATKHDRYHSILTPHRVRNGYYDIFLVDAAGDVVYTNYKELDFQGNLVRGSE